MATYIYPSNAELQRIEQDKLPVLTENDPLFSIMPMVNVDAHVLSWEQQDNYLGLQQVRGLNGQPGKVNKVGGRRYTMEPGVYGEFLDIDEQELTTRRQWGTWAQPISIMDLVMERQDQLLQRRLDRIRYIGWTLLTTGTFAVSNTDGTVTHTDTFSLQTSNGTDWATPATATPLADLRAVQLLSRGHSVSFGPDAIGYMNRVTANGLLSNTNAADIGGKRTAGLANLLSLAEINTLLTGEGLPNLVIYDEGYLTDAGVFTPFIPDDTVVIVGRRPGGTRIADYAMTRNANNPDMAPGAYTKIVDSGEREVPRRITVHDGHNGGPRIYFPSALVIVDVS